MLKLTVIELTCPVCGNRFASRSVQSSEAVYGKHTDFQEEWLGASKLSFRVHLCERCGYAGWQDAFSDCESVSRALEQRVWNELTPRLGDTPLSSSDRYDFAAKVATWQGLGPRRLAELWLSAAWCCVEEHDVEAERYYRRHAARAFAQALAAPKEVERRERAVLTYLVGELWRRIGDARESRAWFDRVPGEVTDPGKQRWIVEAARRQRDDPREWFQRV